jgi:hypothetical protein
MHIRSPCTQPCGGPSEEWGSISSTQRAHVCAALPQVLFFLRIFADIGGRLLPRVFQPHSPSAVLAVATLKLACVPLFFLYIKGAIPYSNDWLMVGYVVAIWGANGYVNSSANMIAPKLVPPHLKSTAAGMMVGGRVGYGHGGMELGVCYCFAGLEVGA